MLAFWATVGVILIGVPSVVVTRVAPVSATSLTPPTWLTKILLKSTFVAGVTSMFSFQFIVIVQVVGLYLAATNAGPTVSIVVIAVYADAALPVPERSLNAPAETSSSLVASAFAAILCEDVSVIVIVVPSTAITVEPVSGIWFAAPVGLMNILLTSTCEPGVASIASLKVTTSVPTVGLALNVAEEIVGAVVSAVTVIALSADAAIALFEISAIAAATTSSCFVPSAAIFAL